MNAGRKRLTRRSVVVAGLSLAGCVRFAAEDETNSTEDGNGGNNTDDDSESAFSTYRLHMRDANGWNGILVDLRGRNEVVVENGAAGGTAFNPAGVNIDPGTTIIWEWVSDGHTVTHANGDAFETEVADNGFTFEYTFEKPGVYNYQCQPHETQGHIGTVVVGDG